MTQKTIRIVLTLYISFSHLVLFSQTSETDNIVGKSLEFKSESLNETRTIQVYVPKAYKEEKNRSFPVLYVLDGQEYFLHGIAYQDMLYFRDKSPGFIIVGINTNRRKRRTLFYKESAKFINFLENELVPYIDSSYRTKKEKERLYFGWEMAGGLGFEILSERNNLFSGYIIASPSHSTDDRMNKIRTLKNDQEKANKFLLVSAAPEEHWITQDTTFLATISKEGQNNINKKKAWRYTVYNNEDHYTTPLKTIHEGLSDYFSDYKPIRLRSVKAYDDYGGLEALRVYYKNRGERYDLSTDIHKETKHFLIYNAMTEDNYERFNSYINEFNGYFESGIRDFWLNRYAKYYLKHNNKTKALYLYNFGIKKFPESVILLEGLGDFYALEKNERKAKDNYVKALSINPNLEEVKTKIERL